MKRTLSQRYHTVSMTLVMCVLAGCSKSAFQNCQYTAWHASLLATSFAKIVVDSKKIECIFKCVPQERKYEERLHLIAPPALYFAAERHRIIRREMITCSMIIAAPHLL